MNRLLENLKSNMDAFTENASKVSNIAAAKRARKLSLEITAQLKQYRKDSIK